MNTPCAGCGLQVYSAEKLVLNGKYFHKGRGCAKCSLCGSNLTTKNFVSVAGEDQNMWYCNAHGNVKPNPSSSQPKILKLQNLTHEPLQQPLQQPQLSNTSKFVAFLKRSIRDEETKRLKPMGMMASRASVRKQVTKDALTEWSTNNLNEIQAFVEDFRAQEQLNKFGGVESSNPLFQASSTMKPSLSSMSNQNQIQNTTSQFDNPTITKQPSYDKPLSSKVSFESSSTTTTPPMSGKVIMNRIVRSIRMAKPIGSSTTIPNTNNSKPTPNVKNMGTPKSFSQQQNAGFGRKNLVSMSLKNVNINNARNVFQKKNGN